MSTRQPDVHAKELVKILERRGFFFSRQSGSHAIYINDEGTRVTVPIHGKRSIGKGLLKQILKDAGISIEELKDELSGKKSPDKRDEQSEAGETAETE